MHYREEWKIATRSKKKIALMVVAAISVMVLLLSIPPKDLPQMQGAGNQPFAWNQNQMWQALETRFRAARSAGCSTTAPEISRRIREGRQQLATLAGKQLDPSDPLFETVESNLFNLGPLMAACPEHITEYAALITSVRDAVKLQSRRWNVHDRKVRDRLYRLLYGGRTALEEVVLQETKETIPAIITGANEPSQTPSFQRATVKLHSGDILLSRGGAPTSALIARGNDYPGNFSHIALLYVDEVTHAPSVIEAHIERGVAISTFEEYLKDVKFRIMAMRVRADHPLLIEDPMLPHRAAKMAFDEAKKRHIPYDFEMDFREPSKQFCSEVASHAYASLGLTLWNITTTMSSKGLVNWLGDFGVRHFETQAPADLEYDPQLVVVAEWRDRQSLWNDHVDNAVVEAMLDQADHGYRLTYDWYLLAPARLVKAYSALLNHFGKVGPVPEGMEAQVALKSMKLDKLHRKMKERVLAEAGSFEQKNGYRPPYWELVRMAGDAFRAQGSL